MATATVSLPNFPCPECGCTEWEVDSIVPDGELEDGVSVQAVPVGGACSGCGFVA